jgi:outer membrane protein TolC
MKTFVQLAIIIGTAAWIIGAAELAFGQLQPDPASYSISTPRPINPAASSTNPSALATQGQNPYLGSTPTGTVTDQEISLSLQQAVERGLRYNLGLIESSQATAEVRAQRLRALSTLLPNLSVKGEQAFEDLSLKEIGFKLPAIPGVPGLPATTGPFNYQDARVSLAQSAYSQELHDRYRAQKSTEQASAFNTRDARDVVVYAVGVTYLQVVASAARVETAKAQLASAR